MCDFFFPLGFFPVYATMKAFRRLMTNYEIGSMNLQFLGR